MNRRQHNLSFKIPNVKIRPAPASASTSTSDSSSRSKRKHEVNHREREMNAMDEEILKQAWDGADDEETSTRKLQRIEEKPWKNIVITFTGVDDKANLSKQAKELGAVVENALTISVTHVVASGYGSAKYAYAVEHRLPVLAPSWIAQSFDNWREGKDLDVANDIEAHRLAPFIGLRIAISGIEPLSRRKTLMNHITTLGGIYSKDLDRQCTHLVSSRGSNDKPSEKIKWALSEIATRAAKTRAGKRVDGEEIKLVYEEWIWDCVAYRGRWKEDFYDIRKPRRDARVNPEDVINGTLNFDTDAVIDPTTEPQPADNEPALVRKRKREGMPTLVDEIISVTGLKAELTSDTSETAPRREASPLPGPTSLSTRTDESVTTGRAALSARTEKKPSMLHISRSTSFSTMAAGTGPSDRTPSTPPPAYTAVIPEPARDTTVDLKSQPEPSGPTEPQGAGITKLFSGLKFSHIILDQKAVFEKALLDHGGTLVSEEDRKNGEEVDYVVVRLSSTIRPWLPVSGKIPQIVTECWVEGCFFEQKLLSPEKHVVFSLLNITTPIPNASELLVHLSGFSAENSVYLRRLLRVLGFTQSQSLNRKTTHLICAAPTGIKYEKALEWKVSVIKDSWLIAAARSGHIESVEHHRHTTSSTPDLPSSKPENRISGSTTSGNMSHMSELGSGIIDPSSLAGYGQAKNPTSSPVQPRISQTKIDSQSHSISPSRLLKLTPTHIDEIPSTSSVKHPNSSATGITNSVPIPPNEMPLSPPRAEAARRLNTLTPTSERTRTIEGVSRTSSAPAQPESAERKGKNTMVEALKRLAEDRDGGDRKRQPRRSRPGSRIKNSPSNSSRYGTPPILTPSPQKEDLALDRERQSSPIRPDESITVKYVDANAERERKRLKDALKRNELNSKSGGGSGSGGLSGFGVGGGGDGFGK